MKTFTFAVLAAAANASVQTDLEDVLVQFWKETRDVLEDKLISAHVVFDDQDYADMVADGEDILAQISAAAEVVTEQISEGLMDQYEDVIQDAWDETEQMLLEKLRSAYLDFDYFWGSDFYGYDSMDTATGDFLY